MDKNILSVFSLDESISFSGIIPFYSSFQLLQLLRLKSELLQKNQNRKAPRIRLAETMKLSRLRFLCKRLYLFGAYKGYHSFAWLQRLTTFKTESSTTIKAAVWSEWDLSVRYFGIYADISTSTVLFVFLFTATSAIPFIKTFQ